MLDSFHLAANEIPVVICRGQVVLRNPSKQEIADCLGFNESINQTQVRDLIIIGAGPSGLAAGSLWRFRRSRCSSVETGSPGGQAGSSSRIENYLGFPTGISGQDLAGRAYLQAQKFGAEILITKGMRLHCAHKPYAVEVENGVRIPARAVVIATGAAYRKPQCEKLPRFEGAGIYYAATPIEAQLCGGEEVIIVGGGNAAGQAASVPCREGKAHTHACPICKFGR